MVEVDSVLVLFQYGIPISASSDKPCMVLLAFSVVILDIGKVYGGYHMLLHGLRIDVGIDEPSVYLTDCHVSVSFCGVVSLW